MDNWRVEERTLGGNLASRTEITFQLQ